MRSRLKAFIKRNKFFYHLYFLVGSFALRMLGFFVKTDPNLILFISYGGQKFDDSPRAVYEYLLNSDFSDKYRYVWAFLDPKKHPEVENCVQVDTLAYYLTALKAGYWITNSSASRGLDFKKKKTKNILFVHGMTGIKKIGNDTAQPQKAFRSAASEEFDLIFVEGKKEVPILLKAWNQKESVYRITGLPRNDDLVTFTKEDVNTIKKRLNLPFEKKVILYAPTFREFNRANNGLNVLGIPFDFKKWENQLGDEYVLLVTAHYEVAKLLDDLPENNFVYNAFKYPVLNDLLKVSDILISDYSSIVFDYSILERPIFCYAYDYDIYVKERGLYTDLNTLFSKGVLCTEDDLLSAIKDMDYRLECQYTKENIKKEYIAAYGNATDLSVQEIFRCN